MFHVSFRIFKHAQVGLDYFKNFLLSFSALLALLLTIVIAIVLGENFRRSLKKRQIVIRELAVPEALSKSGFTGAVAAQKIKAAFEEVIAVTRRYVANNGRLLAQKDIPIITLPGTGFSLDFLAAQLREILGLKNYYDVTGDVIASKTTNQLNIQVNGKSVYNEKILGKDFTHADFLAPTLALIKEADPLVYIAYYINKIVGINEYVEPEALSEIKKLALEIVSTLHNRQEKAVAYRLLGLTYDYCKDFEPAIDAYKKAIELDKKFARPHNNLGFVYLDLAKVAENIDKDTLYQKAITAFEKAIKLDSKFAYPHIGLGVVYDDQASAENDKDKKSELWSLAIAKYQKAIELEGKYAAAYFNLGIVYNDQAKFANNPDEKTRLWLLAIETTEKAARLDPNDKDIFGNLYNYYQNLADITTDEKQKSEYLACSDAAREKWRALGGDQASE